jgi:micrococcal nuclease
MVGTIAPAGPAANRREGGPTPPLWLVLSALVIGLGRFAPVERVVDGDTIRVRLGERVEVVRYIGVDTPETVHPTRGVEPYGRAAAEANRALVEGKVVRLYFDVELRDHYGRLLAYVFVGEVFVNAELLRQGYAQLMTVPPNVRCVELFVRMQREAREAGRGLWGEPPPACPDSGH